MLADVHVRIGEDGVVVAIVNVVPPIIRGLVDQLDLEGNLEVVERSFKQVDLEADSQLVPHRVFEEMRVFIVLEGYCTATWSYRDKNIINA